MKIAIASTGNTLDAQVDNRFGRCSYFIIYDTETKKHEVIDNPNKEANEGAGPATVKLIASQNVNKVVCGQFGFKIKSLMNDLEIQMITPQEPKTVEAIINSINN